MYGYGARQDTERFDTHADYAEWWAQEYLGIGHRWLVESKEVKKLENDSVLVSVKETKAILDDESSQARAVRLIVWVDDDNEEMIEMFNACEDPL